MRNTTGNDGSARVPRRSGVAGLFAVPRRAEAAADPSRAWVLDARTARVLSDVPLGVIVEAICRFVEPRSYVDPNQSLSEGGSADAQDLDDVISLDEAARILNVERSWIIRNASKLPFVRRLSRKNSVCSRSALKRWVATRPSSARGS